MKKTLNNDKVMLNTYNDEFYFSEISKNNKFKNTASKIYRLSYFLKLEKIEKI